MHATSEKGNLSKRFNSLKGGEKWITITIQNNYSLWETVP